MTWLFQRTRNYERSYWTVSSFTRTRIFVCTSVKMPYKINNWLLRNSNKRYLVPKTCFCLSQRLLSSTRSFKIYQMIRLIWKRSTSSCVQCSWQLRCVWTKQFQSMKTSMSCSRFWKWRNSQNWVIKSLRWVRNCKELDFMRWELVENLKKSRKRITTWVGCWKAKWIQSRNWRNRFQRWKADFTSAKKNLEGPTMKDSNVSSMLATII